MTDDELLAIIHAGAEGRNWDFKAPMAWDEKDGKMCCAIVKHILAFANTDGGFLVIGVDDKTRKRVGVSDEQNLSFDESRIGRFVNSYAAPPIEVSLKRLPDAQEGKKYVILGAPVFADIPHICQKDYPGVLRRAGVYVRNANMETVLVCDPADMGAMIERAIRNRSDALLRSFDAVLRRRGAPPPPADEERFRHQVREAVDTCHSLVAEKDPAFVKDTGWIEVVSYPSLFEQRRFPASARRETIRRAASHLGYSTFPELADDDRTYAIPEGLQTFAVYDRWLWGVDFWQCRQSGLFVHRSALVEDLPSDRRSDRRILWFDSFVRNILHAVVFAANLYGALEVPAGEHVKVMLSISGCRGRVLAAADPRRRLGLDYVSQVDTIAAERTVTVPEWRAQRDSLTIEMAQEVLRLFNCDRVPDSVLQGLIDECFSGKP